MNYEQLVARMNERGAVGWTLETWTLGKPFVGVLTRVEYNENTIRFYRAHIDTSILHTDPETHETRTIWVKSERQELLVLDVDTSTDFVVDPLGRISFWMGKLGRATLYAPGVDPKQALPSSKG